jgi:hypothetical protein
MSDQKFSKKEALSYGFNTFKSNVGFFVGLVAIVFAIYFIERLITRNIQPGAPMGLLAVAFVIGLGFWLIERTLDLGLIRVGLKYADGAKGSLQDLPASFPTIWGPSWTFWKYVAGLILYGLIVLGGLILLIVPGIIWGIQFQFFAYYILTEGCSPVEALKKSAAITKGSKVNLFLFGLLMALVNLAGLLCLVVGLVVTVPTTLVAMAYVFRKLSGTSQRLA